MKKITKLSLAASLILTTSSYADTLAEAFANSKVKGEIKVQYFDVQPAAPGAGSGKSDTIAVAGGNLNLITGSFYGLKAGVTFQTSHVLSDSINGANNFAATMDASGSVMSESYLSYAIANTSVKVGRQYISTPLVAGSGSRMIRQSFEAYTLMNTDLPDTTVTASYVNKYQNRTDNAGEPGEFDKFEDGAYTIHAKNSSIDAVTLQGQYLKVKGAAANTDKDVYYFDAKYDAKVVNVSAQVLDSSNGNVDGTMYGLKVNGNVGVVNLTGLYTTTTNDGDVYNGVGSGADASFTALPLHGGGVTYFKNTDTLVGVAVTKVAGAVVAAYYGEVKSPDGNNVGGAKKIKAFGGFVDYAFNKNFSAKVMYESADFDTLDNDDNIFRVYTSYKF